MDFEHVCDKKWTTPYIMDDIYNLFSRVLMYAIYCHQKLGNGFICNSNYHSKLYHLDTKGSHGTRVVRQNAKANAFVFPSEINFEDIVSI
jgi:hypothetical protein